MTLLTKAVMSISASVCLKGWTFSVLQFLLLRTFIASFLCWSAFECSLCCHNTFQIDSEIFIQPWTFSFIKGIIRKYWLLFFPLGLGMDWSYLGSIVPCNGHYISTKNEKLFIFFNVFSNVDLWYKQNKMLKFCEG